MNTGDIVTDSRAAAWTLQTMLGEGVWGTSWLVEAGDGRRRVLKLPYEAGDLPAAAADRVSAMRAASVEQADKLAESDGLLTAIEDRITLPSGATALLLPHYPTTLARQLRSGVPLIDALTTLHRVAEKLASTQVTHGNLRPENILIDAAGEPLLADILTPSMGGLTVHADRAHAARRRWSAPDTVGRDTWALCQALHCAAVSEDGGSGGELPAEPGRLDKVSLSALRESVEQRLKREGANTRFVARCAERLAKLLGRGLSIENDPSPPFRFIRASDLAHRLGEVLACIDPAIDSVGRILLSSAAKGEVFEAPAVVGFTVSVAPAVGVSDADDVVCGVRLMDLDKGERVPLEDAQFTVDRHASGRLRYAFNLPEVPPGRYEVSVAFSIKDSGHTPAAAVGSFEVRPPAGYVPPTKEAEPTPLSFPGQLTPMAPKRPSFDDDDEDDEATVLIKRRPSVDHAVGDTDPDLDSDPGGEVIDAFPRPLAPTGPGTAVEATPPPPPERLVPAPVPAPKPLVAVPTPPPSEPGSAAGEPSSVVPSTEPVPQPMASAPQAWSATQEGEADFFANDAPLPEAPLPGVGQDPLGGVGEELGAAPPGGLDTLKNKALDLANGDSRVFVGATVVGCFLLVLLTAGLLRACS